MWSKYTQASGDRARPCSVHAAPAPLITIPIIGLTHDRCITILSAFRYGPLHHMFSASRI